MKVRQHRGGLHDSMETVESIEPSLDAIAAWAERVYGLKAHGFQCRPSDLTIKPYGYDQRIHWDTYIIVLAGYGVLGFSDGAVAPEG